MGLIHRRFIAATCACLLSACASAPSRESAPHADHASMAAPNSTLAQWAKGAQRLDGLGAYSRKVTTSSPEAQAWFDQGLNLIYGFNHDEAVRSFAKAAEIDPACAMCYWGAVAALGPNYNMPAMEQRWQVLWNALQSAQQHAAQGTPAEQALIVALGKRYAGPAPVPADKMQPFNDVYANAMRDVAKQYPADDDAQVFFAEALMTANPWKLWSNDGKAAPGTDEIVATLERVIARNPMHPGANHYFIHAVEASPHPEKALAAADRLAALMPGAGHIVHMPAHIYQRVGRYADASAANIGGARADAAYVDTAKPPDWMYYSGMYFTHNYQFLGYSEAMRGRSAAALQAMHEMRSRLTDESLHMGAGLDWYAAEPWFVMERFGRWQDILATPAPDPKLFGLSAAYRYARCAAFAATGRIDAALAEKAKLDAIAMATPADAPAGLNKARDLIAVASAIATAHIAAAQGRRSDAIAALHDAVAKEDKLDYDEPADWFIPVRHLLGAELLHERRAKEAEQVYREDLLRHPENGWALYGLAQSLKAQGKARQAAAVERRFAQAWKDADVVLTSSYASSPRPGASTPDS
jgi:tetratricopeptide (TPR) repeat protein